MEPDALDHIRDFVRFSLALGDLDGRALLTNGAVRPAPDPAFQQYLRPAERFDAQLLAKQILGETRFNPDGTLDITKWARPQHDGPALRALGAPALLAHGRFRRCRHARCGAPIDRNRSRFHASALARASRSISGRKSSAITITRSWSSSAALADGAQWLDELGDSDRARCLSRRFRAKSLIRLDDHWAARQGLLSQPRRRRRWRIR